MEWGPRALGNRSILADPTDPNIKNVINSKIKKRTVQAFAPVVLAETAEKYFNMLNHDSRFMNIVFKAKNLTKMKFLEQFMMMELLVYRQLIKKIIKNCII